MARKLIPRLQEWEKSQLANVVVIKGEGRAFCAGGDVTALAQDNQKGAEGQQASKDYFGLEYQLDHQIATYSKPYVAFIDGITMGGGVGLSVHAPFRIATENTVFAMPETTIGFFPDVGASFFLPRMDGELGMYLALTSEQLKGVNVFYAGIATHYLHSTSLPSLEARLAELQFKDSATLQSRLQIINSTIEEFATGLPHDQSIAAPVGGQIRAAVDYVFQPANNFDDIIAALEGLEQTQSDIEEIRSWAKRTRETILQRSPTSARVTLRQLREGGKWSIAETFRREHLIASRFMEHADFVEGVSSLLIRKPKTTPKWSPGSSAEVSEQDIDAFFDGTPGLQLMGTGDYLDYPHAWVGLPREGEVEAYVSKKGGLTKDAVVSHFEEGNGGKQGTREKLEEILARKTTEGGDGSVTWKR
ncbi:3-hydroxyisobutyryl-CoA hydrolase [Oleoguttula sp. CCFEE 5521]